MTKTESQADVLIQSVKWCFEVIRQYEECLKSSSRPTDDILKAQLKLLYNNAVKAVQWVNRAMLPLGLHSSVVGKMSIEELSERLESININIPENLLHL